MNLDEIAKKYGGTTTTVAPTTGSTTDLSSIASKYGGKVTTLPKEGEPNYFQRVASDYTEAGKKIVSEVERGASVLQAGQTGKMLTIPEVLSSSGKLLETGLRTVGQVAISAFTPIVEAPIIKPFLQKIGEKIIGYTPIKSIIKDATELAKKYPETAKDFEAIVNITTLGTGKAVSAPLKTETKAIGKDIIAGTKNLLTPSEEVVQSNIQKLFQKSIKPTAKKTLAQGEKYQNDTLNALRTIKNNVDSLNIIDETGEIVIGRTPKNLNELAQAVDQTKKTVFTQYDTLAKKAGTAGAIIDAKPLATEVAKVAQNRALQITNPEVVKYAEDWAKRLQGLDVLDTETTQAVIQNLNNNLQAFYKNPTYESASKAAIDAGVVNNFRKALDTAIEGATGEQYQILKNQYGALKAIENDVVRASMRDARKNVKGLLDYSDIFTSGQMVGGALSLNPAMFTKGAIERGFKEYFKYLNDPNRAINNIFKQLGKKTSSESFVPQSATGKFLQNPKLGLSFERVGRDYAVDAPLSKIPQSTINKIPAKIREEAKDTYEIALRLDTGTNFEYGAVRSDYMNAFQKGAVTPDDIRTLRELHFLLKGNEKITSSTAGSQLPKVSETQQKVVNTSSKTIPQSNINASLLQEAKKYKSAEEFVKGQGTPIYHGTSLENATKINTEGFKTGSGKGVSGKTSNDFVYATGNKVSAEKYVSDRLGIKNPTVVEGGFNGKTLEINGKMADFEAFGEASNKLGVPLGVDSQGKLSMLDIPAVKKAMQEQGYGAISFSDRYANGSKAFAILPESLKTKSQLIDIWKKANKK